jgi:hypothetical protein
MLTRKQKTHTYLRFNTWRAYILSRWSSFTRVWLEHVNSCAHHFLPLVLVFVLLFFLYKSGSMYFFLLAIVLSILLRYTDSDYPFGIFKLFLLLQENKTMEKIVRLVNLIFRYTDYDSWHKHPQVLMRTHLCHTTNTERQTSYVDLYRDIDKGQLCSKIYDKGDDLHFPVVNLFSWLCTSPPPLVTRCLHAYSKFILFMHIKQISQCGLRESWTYWPLQTFCGRHHDLVKISSVVTDVIL